MHEEGAMANKINIAVLISGSGSNLQSIIDDIEAGSLDADIKMIISNKPEAYALERARKHNIPSTVVKHGDFETREAFEQALLDVLEPLQIDLVVLAGFMRVLTSHFLQAYSMRIINIHPALLPSFPGIHVQKKAVEYGAKFSGCTVHFVDEGTDTGPIIIQAVVPLLDEDTDETLAARILKEEHKIYPRAIQLIAEGKLIVEGRRVLVKEGSPPEETTLINPPLES